MIIRQGVEMNFCRIIMVSLFYHYKNNLYRAHHSVRFAAGAFGAIRCARQGFSSLRDNAA
jgi:hypothetical protein